MQQLQLFKIEAEFDLEKIQIAELHAMNYGSVHDNKQPVKRTKESVIHAETEQLSLISAIDLHENASYIKKEIDYFNEQINAIQAPLELVAVHKRNSGFSSDFIAVDTNPYSHYFNQLVRISIIKGLIQTTWTRWFIECNGSTYNRTESSAEDGGWVRTTFVSILNMMIIHLSLYLKGMRRHQFPS